MAYLLTRNSRIEEGPVVQFERTPASAPSPNLGELRQRGRVTARYDRNKTVAGKLLYEHVPEIGVDYIQWQDSRQQLANERGSARQAGP
jgi:hypothetical protein